MTKAEIDVLIQRSLNNIAERVPPGTEPTNEAERLGVAYYSGQIDLLQELREAVGA